MDKDTAQRNEVTRLLFKDGFNEREIKSMLRLNYEDAKRIYPGATAKQLYNTIRSLEY